MALDFKKISPGTVRWQALTQRHARGVSVKAGGRDWRLEAAGLPIEPCGTTLYATWGAAEIVVWIGDWRVAAATVLETPPSVLERLPEPVARAALECFAADGLAALERSTGLPFALTRIDRVLSAPPTSACGFRLRRDDGLAIGGAWTAVDKDGSWLATLERTLAARTVPPAALPDDLPLTGVVTLGSWRWTVRDLSFEAGDVVLPPGGVEEEGARIVTVGGALRFAARMANGILSVEGKTMTAATAPDSSASASIDAVEVELSAEVGRLRLTLAQLKQLGAGQVVEFSTPVEAPVTMMVGGTAIATGELVDVGGRVGVRIIAMSVAEEKA